MSAVSRRVFLATCGRLGISAALVTAGLGMACPVGCRADDATPGSEDDEDRPSKAEPETRLNAMMRIAWRDQDTLIASGERCSVTPGLLAALGVQVGDQVRVYRPAGDGDGADEESARERVALFTIATTHDTETDPTVRIGRGGRARLGAADDDELAVELSARVVHPTLEAALAREAGEYIEIVDDDGAAAGAFIAAPHGGAIEVNTDKQAARVYERLSTAGHAADVTCWRCLGYRDAGAFATWHITSTELSCRSLAGLAATADRGYRHAVAFHGHSGSDMIVGGAAPMARKQAMAAAINAALDGTDVRAVAVSSGALSGTSGANFVNWITADGKSGIQIEQPQVVRKEHWEAIAHAVADELAKWLAE